MSKDLLNLTSERWDDVARFTRAVERNSVEHGMEDDGHNCNGNDGPKIDSADVRINLTPLVQTLSLRVVRMVIFNRDDKDSIKDSDLLRITRSINRV